MSFSYEVILYSAYIFLHHKRLKQTGNSRQSSSVVNSLGSFLMAPHKSYSCLWLFPFPPYDNFKHPSYLFAVPGPTNITTMTRQYTQFPLTFVYLLASRPQHTFHEIPTHRGISIVQRVFLKFISLFMVFTFQIIYQYSRSELT